MFATYWVKHQATVYSSHWQRQTLSLRQGAVQENDQHSPSTFNSLGQRKEIWICSNYLRKFISGKWHHHILNMMILQFFHSPPPSFLNREIATMSSDIFCPWFSGHFWPAETNSSTFWPIFMGQDICESSPQARPLGYWNWTWWILNADSEICITPYFHIFPYHHLPHQQNQPNNDANFN